MHEHIDMLLTSVEGSSEWRADKAAQYPDDKRNIRSSEALAKLAQRLKTLPDGHPKLGAYSELLQCAIDADCDLSDYSAFESSYIGRYGFDYPEDGDPETFMDGLIEELTECVEEAVKRVKEQEDEKAFQALKERADEAAKEEAHEAADEAAKEAAEEAAKEAAQEAYTKAHKETYENTYKEVY